MADNGKRIGPSSLRVCKKCGAHNLAWTQSKSGKWYLCTTFASQSETKELYIMATWNAHRCSTTTEVITRKPTAQENYIQALGKATSAEEVDAIIDAEIARRNG